MLIVSIVHRAVWNITISGYAPEPCIESNTTRKPRSRSAFISRSAMMSSRNLLNGFLRYTIRPSAAASSNSACFTSLIPSISSSTRLVVSIGASRPSSTISFKPLYSLGLCEAVISTPKCSPWSFTVCITSGVGAERCMNHTVTPPSASTSATHLAADSDKNLRS